MDWQHAHRYEQIVLNAGKKEEVVKSVPTTPTPPPTTKESFILPNKELLKIRADIEKAREDYNNITRINADLISKIPINRDTMRMTHKQKKEMAFNRSLFIMDANEAKKKDKEMFLSIITDFSKQFEKIPNRDGTQRKIYFTEIEQARMAALYRHKDIYHGLRVYGMLNDDRSIALNIKVLKERIDDEERRLIHDIIFRDDVTFEEIRDQETKLRDHAIMELWTDKVYEAALNDTQKIIDDYVKTYKSDESDESDESEYMPLGNIYIYGTIPMVLFLTGLLKLIAMLHRDRYEDDPILLTKASDKILKTVDENQNGFDPIVPNPLIKIPETLGGIAKQLLMTAKVCFCLFIFAAFARTFLATLFPVKSDSTYDILTSLDYNLSQVNLNNDTFNEGVSYATDKACDYYTILNTTFDPKNATVQEMNRLDHAATLLVGVVGEKNLTDYGVKTENINEVQELLKNLEYFKIWGSRYRMAHYGGTISNIIAYFDQEILRKSIAEHIESTFMVNNIVIKDTLDKIRKFKQYIDHPKQRYDMDTCSMWMEETNYIPDSHVEYVSMFDFSNEESPYITYTWELLFGKQDSAIRRMQRAAWFGQETIAEHAFNFNHHMRSHARDKLYDISATVSSIKNGIIPLVYFMSYLNVILSHLPPQVFELFNGLFLLLIRYITLISRKNITLTDKQITDINNIIETMKKYIYDDGEITKYDESAVLENLIDKYINGTVSIVGCSIVLTRILRFNAGTEKSVYIGKKTNILNSDVVFNETRMWYHNITNNIITPISDVMYWISGILGGIFRLEFAMTIWLIAYVYASFVPEVGMAYPIGFLVADYVGSSYIGEKLRYFRGTSIILPFLIKGIIMMFKWGVKNNVPHRSIDLIISKTTNGRKIINFVIDVFNKLTLFDIRNLSLLLVTCYILNETGGSFVPIRLEQSGINNITCANNINNFTSMMDYLSEKDIPNRTKFFEDVFKNLTETFPGLV